MFYRLHSIKAFTLSAFLLISIFISPQASSTQSGTAWGPFLGDWAHTLPDNSAGWLGISEEDDEISLQLVWSVGYVRAVEEFSLAKGELEFVRRKNADGSMEKVIAIAHGNKLEMTLVKKSAEGHISKSSFTGIRQPPIPPKPDLDTIRYGKSITLFNGENLNGWKLIPKGAKNGWSVQDGVLVNSTPKTSFSPYSDYGNLRTVQEFEDFTLQLEFRLPTKGNSGIYLRGMYEVQVVDRDSSMQGIHGPGSVFSRIKPITNAGKPGPEWQSYKITLLDRHITVILNDIKVIDNQPVEGCTGGALWSDVTRKGPIYLQGDHTTVEYRNIMLTPIIKP